MEPDVVNRCRAATVPFDAARDRELALKRHAQEQPVDLRVRTGLLRGTYEFELAAFLHAFEAIKMPMVLCAIMAGFASPATDVMLWNCFGNTFFYQTEMDLATESKAPPRQDARQLRGPHVAMGMPRIGERRWCLYAYQYHENGRFRLVLNNPEDHDLVVSGGFRPGDTTVFRFTVRVPPQSTVRLVSVAPSVEEFHLTLDEYRVELIRYRPGMLSSMSAPSGPLMVYQACIKLLKQFKSYASHEVYQKIADVQLALAKQLDALILTHPYENDLLAFIREWFGVVINSWKSNDEVALSLMTHPGEIVDRSEALEAWLADNALAEPVSNELEAYLL